MKKNGKKGTGSRQIKVPVELHKGNAMMYLARLYGTLRQVVGELVQNQIDKKANHSRIIVDLVKRRLLSYDNGVGATRTEMDHRIQNIGDSVKGLDDIGKKGIGNLAPLGIMGPGSRYRLTTHPVYGHGSKQYYTYHMDFDLVEHVRDPEFIREDHPAGFTLKFEKGVVKGVSTKVEVTKISKSALREYREKSADEVAVDLSEYLKETYSGSILSKHINIHIVVIDASSVPSEILVKPQEFKGNRTTEIFSTKAGDIKFDMYVTSAKQKKPVISVRHRNQVDFPLKKAYSMKDLWRAIRDLIGNGYFQGIIHTDMCELNENRTDFQHGEERDVFEDAVLGYVGQYIQPIVEEIKNNQDAQRHASIIHRVLDSFSTVLDDNPELAEKFKGTVPAGRPSGEPEFVSLWRSHGPDKKSKKKRKYVKSGNYVGIYQPPTGELRKGSGSLSQIFRTHDGGLTLVIREPDPTHPRGLGWRIRRETEGPEKGWIIVNQSHIDFKAIQESTAAEQTYLQYLVSKLFAEAYMPDGHKAVFSLEFEEAWLPFAMRYITPLIARGGGGRSKKT